MIIRKTFNNNAVLAEDGGEEFIITGNGIGYNRHIGDEVDEKLIEKKYILAESDKQRYLNIFSGDRSFYDVASRIMDDASRIRDDLGDYPDYLYDSNIFNDVNYFFNKEVLFDIAIPMLADATAGKEGGITSFDDYANWMDTAEFGADVVLGDRTEFAEPTSREPFVDEVKQQVEENITQNVVQLAKDNPDIQFYYYFTPYSIAWWGSQNELGTVQRWIAAEKYAIELMLECDNIHLFSFNNEFDVTTNLDNYSDECHHGDWINSQILGWMYSGTDELTKDNYEEYINVELDFYTTYNYKGLFE